MSRNTSLTLRSVPSLFLTSTPRAANAAELSFPPEAASTMLIESFFVESASASCETSAVAAARLIDEISSTVRPVC